MRKRLALVVLVGLITALALPAGAKSRTTFGLAGEARALEVALLDQGVTLGLAMTEANSLPEAVGVGAGQCSLLGDLTDISDLPCTGDTTVKSRYPGNPGGAERCGGGLPAPLNAVLDLKTACGMSKAGLTGGLPSVNSSGKVAELVANLPIDLLLPIDTSSTTAEVEAVVDQLTGVLSPVLDAAPAEVEAAVDNLVDSLLSLIGNLDVSDLVEVRLGPSTSDVIPKGKTVTVKSAASGAEIGVLGLPTVDPTSGTVEPGDALKNGLIIVEVGTAEASAVVDNATATARGAASAALVTVKVRDITKTTPSYVEISIAPGQTITLLEGTPLESTITAADTHVVENSKGATAAADAVRLHLLKGVQGGVKLGLARATAAAKAAAKKAPAPAPKKRPPTLPVTGGTDYTAVALVLMLAAAGTMVLRRKFSAR